MDYRSAGEIKRGKTTAQRGVQQAAFSPYHMRHGVIDNKRPQNHEQQHGAELHALGESAGDQRRRDDCEHELVNHVALQRNSRGVVRIGLQPNTLKK